MIKYNDIINNLGGIPKVVPKIYAYRAYKDGGCKVFSTYNKANEYSKLNESYLLNELEYLTSLELLKKFKKDSYNIWRTTLRSEHKNLNDDIFDLCLSYIEGNESSLDQCVYDMEDLSVLIENITKHMEIYKAEYDGIKKQLHDANTVIKNLTEEMIWYRNYYDSRN